MLIDFFGANCLRLRTPDISLVFDDNLKALGGKSVATAKDIVCLTDANIERPAVSKMVFDMPGEYEINKVFITALMVEGWQTGHMTTYKVFVEGLNYVITGNIKAELNDQQLETLDTVDVLFVPIGGETTLDAKAAQSLVKNLNPRLVIPTTYRQKGLKFSQKWAESEEFIQRLALEPEWLQSSWRLKKNTLGDQLNLKIFKP